MKIYNLLDEVKISGDDFARLLSEICIQKGFVPPRGDEIRDSYEYIFEIKKIEDGYELTINKKPIENYIWMGK